MKKLICILVLATFGNFAFAQEELSPAEKEMVEVAKERIKKMRKSKRRHSPSLRARMQSEAEAVRVEEEKKK